MKNMNCTALALGLLGLAVGAAQTHAQSPSYVQFMKAKLKRFPAKLFCAVALGIGSSLSLASAAAREVVSVERGASEDGERESVERGATLRRSDALRSTPSVVAARREGRRGLPGRRPGRHAHRQGRAVALRFPTA